MAQLLAVGLFGLVGVFARWSLDVLAGRWFEVFPVGILAINIVGSLIAGAVYVMGTEKALFPQYLSIGLLVGFCGGFTTFSAYALQAFLLLEKGSLIKGLGYLFLSPLLGILGAYLGVISARAWT